MFKSILATLSIALMATAFITQAEELKSDWIEPVKGARERTLGASVRDVQTDDRGRSTVTIAIPKLSVANGENMEEVVVVGRQPDQTEAPVEFRHEWVSDYENDNYGLVLYLGEDGNVPLRFYLKSPH